MTLQRFWLDEYFDDATYETATLVGVTAPDVAPNIGPANMVLNNRLGTVDVDARTGMVSLDGEAVYSAPSDEVSLSRLYFL